MSTASDTTGAVETLSVSGSTLTLSGWAIDPDTTTPISVDVSVDSSYIGSLPAASNHTKVSDTTRTNIGFTGTFTIPAGSHTVCVRAIGDGNGNNTRLTCKTVSTTRFEAGSIISDELMYNGAAMTATQVQEFLSSKNPSCESKPGGISCLKDFRTDTPNMQYPNCAAYVGSPQETASAVIAKAGSACNISQKVLLVMLQKEQGLVLATSNNLTSSKYAKAMGLGCPTGSTCDSSRAGFEKQVYGAASRLATYRAEPNQFRFQMGKTVEISYSPTSVCGSSPVHLENTATAALYNYTPYQPNAAALNNLYGSGDSCSTYGNRNFWRYFRDWFAPTGAAS